MSRTQNIQRRKDRSLQGNPRRIENAAARWRAAAQPTRRQIASTASRSTGSLQRLRPCAVNRIRRLFGSSDDRPGPCSGRSVFTCGRRADARMAGHRRISPERTLGPEGTVNGGESRKKVPSAVKPIPGQHAAAGRRSQSTRRSTVGGGASSRRPRWKRRPVFGISSSATFRECDG